AKTVTASTLVIVAHRMAQFAPQAALALLTAAVAAPYDAEGLTALLIACTKLIETMRAHGHDRPPQTLRLLAEACATIRSKLAAQESQLVGTSTTTASTATTTTTTTTSTSGTTGSGLETVVTTAIAPDLEQILDSLDPLEQILKPLREKVERALEFS